MSHKRLMQGLGFYTKQRIVQFDAYQEIEAGALVAPDHDEYFLGRASPPEEGVEVRPAVFIATDEKFTFPI